MPAVFRPALPWQTKDLWIERRRLSRQRLARSPNPLPYTPNSILSLLYTRDSGFSATTAAFSSFVRSFTSPDGSIGAPTTIVTPRR